MTPTYTPYIQQNSYCVNYAETANISAENYSTDDIVSYALQYDFVLGARAFVWNGNTVVAVITTPFYLKSERDSAMKDMETELNTLLNSETVIVTFDTQIYRNIREEMTDEEKERLYEMTISRRN